MVAPTQLSSLDTAATQRARLCPFPGLMLFLALGGLGACASSADRKTEAMRELEAVEAKVSEQGRRECKPGSTASCFDGPPTAAGRGLCRDGERVCNAWGRWGPCKGQVLPKKFELCNGVDDNCNGIIDDGFPRIGTACTVGKGQCQGRGVYQCRADGTVADCVAQVKNASPEICDGIDNDCDGKVDELDHQDGTERCRTGKPGACAEGRRRCRRGKVQCVPLHAPTHEVCNGRDDDCDGKIDDNCSSS